MTDLSVKKRLIAFVLVPIGIIAGSIEGKAGENGTCGDSGTDIATDRPDVTNSSLVVPFGSLQLENGDNWTTRQQTTVLDGANSRVRLGVAQCTEFLVDLPNYFHPLQGTVPSGFSDLSPAVKHQFGPLPGDIDLSATVGLELPVGNQRIAGSGYGGYIQFPWSKDIGDGWWVSGMLTTFWMPGVSRGNPTLEQTFSLEREIGSRAAWFVEYVDDHPLLGVPSQIFNTGGTYRITATQQIDFHVGAGLNRAAPDYFFGFGYSFRFDSLF
jgi:hypothetical protein